MSYTELFCKLNQIVRHKLCRLCSELNYLQDMNMHRHIHYVVYKIFKIALVFSLILKLDKKFEPYK